jgi:hypothetical protein
MKGADRGEESLRYVDPIQPGCSGAACLVKGVALPEGVAGAEAVDEAMPSAEECHLAGCDLLWPVAGRGSC